MSDKIGTFICRKTEWHEETIPNFMCETCGEVLCPVFQILRRLTKLEAIVGTEGWKR